MLKQEYQKKMVRKKNIFFYFVSIMILIVSCDNATNSDLAEGSLEDKNQTEVDSDLNAQLLQEEIIDSSLIDVQTDLSTNNFIKNLKNGNNLSGFFAENWTFIYHENNRWDGSTDGQVHNLKRTQIDEVITLNVFTDGEGWEENPSEKKNYDLDFQLKKRVKDWDGFNTENIDEPEKNMVYISTISQSEYLQVYYNDDKLIVKLQFNMEDPG